MLRSKWGAALTLSLILMVSAATVGLAADYQRVALDHIAEKLSISADSIVVEGFLRDLPLTGEQIWIGRYYIPGDQDSFPGREPEKDSQPGAVDDGDGEDSASGTDGGSADTPKLLPLPSGDISDPAAPAPEDRSSGTIYIHTATGEILDHEQAQAFFDREFNLQQAEWERLTRESGRISVSLYMRLGEASPGEIFEITIWPLYIETDEMRRAIDEIIAQYPDLEFRDRGYPGAQILPGVSVEPSAPGDYHILPVPDDRIDAPEPAPDTRTNSDDAVVDIIIDDTWELYQEMYEKLDQVYIQGFTDSLAGIASTLEGMGVSYELEPGMHGVTAELTADQILSLRDADHIESIAEAHYLFATDDALRLEGEAAPAIGLADADTVSQAPIKDGSFSAWLVSSLLLVAGAGTALIVSRRRKVR